MSFWPFRKTNEHKNCLVNNKSECGNIENESSQDNLLQPTTSVKSDSNANSCTEEFVAFSFSNGVMERLKGGHFLRDISHGCRPENFERDILNMITPNEMQSRQQEVLNGIEDPQEFKRILKELALNSNALYQSFNKIYGNHNFSSNTVKTPDKKSNSCFEGCGIQQFLERQDVDNTNSLDVFYVEVPTNDNKRKSTDDTKGNCSSIRKASVPKKQEKETLSANCIQKKLSDCQGDINVNVSQTCKPVCCCKHLDCTKTSCSTKTNTCKQSILYRCSPCEEDPSSSSNMCKNKDNERRDEDEKRQNTIKYCCKRLDCKQYPACLIKPKGQHMMFSCKPCCPKEKSKACKELEDYLKGVRKEISPDKDVNKDLSYCNQEDVNMTASQSSQPRKSDEIPSNKKAPSKSSRSNQGDTNERSSQIHQSVKSLDSKNARSSLRKSSEYKQEEKNIPSANKLPNRSANDRQENENKRVSQTYQSVKDFDPENSRSSLRNSSEYKQEGKEVPPINNQPKKSFNNSQRHSSARNSQTQQSDLPLDSKNRGSSLKKSNEYEQQQDKDMNLESENSEAKNFPQRPCENSQGDARISQTSQPLKSFERNGDTCSSTVRERPSEICQPIEYCCKRLDSKDYPPWLIKPNGCKQPIIFSCKPCRPEEKSNVRKNPCKELEDYLKSIKKEISSDKNVNRDSSYNNQEDVNVRASQSNQTGKSNEYKQQAPYDSSKNSQGDSNEKISQIRQSVKSLDPKIARSSLRKSSEYKQEEKEMPPANKLRKESFNSSQRDSSARDFQTRQSSSSSDSKNRDSSLRKSNEYQQQQDKDINLETVNSKPKNFPKRSCDNSQGDARVSQTSQLLKPFDCMGDASSSIVSERPFEICQPIEYCCKRLDCKDYPPWLIKPNGCKQPIMFSCRPCRPQENLNSKQKSKECKELEDYLKGNKKEMSPDMNVKRKSSNNQEDVNERIPRPNQIMADFDDKEDRPSLRKTNEYKQQENSKKLPRESSNNSKGDANGRNSQAYQNSKCMDTNSGRSSLRKSNEISPATKVSKESSYNNQKDANEKEKPLSSLRTSNEYKQQEISANNNQGDASKRASQSYQPAEALDLKKARSSLRKSNEYKHTEHNGNNASNIQRDVRTSQTTQVFKAFDGKEDDVNRKDNNIEEEIAPAGSETINYCCKRIDNKQCQPCFMKNNTCKPLHVYRCRPCDSNQDSSSKRKVNACSELKAYLASIKRDNTAPEEADIKPRDSRKEICKPTTYCRKRLDCKQVLPCLRKSNVCIQPIIYRCSKKCTEFANYRKTEIPPDECRNSSHVSEKDQPCLLKMEILKLPAKYCCQPCNSKPYSSCLNKTNNLKESIECRCKPCCSKEDHIELMKTQVIRKLVDCLKELKVQLTSANNMEEAFYNANKPEGSRQSSHTYQHKGPLQMKRNSGEDSPQLVQQRQQDYDLQNRNNNFPAGENIPKESYKSGQQEERKEMTPPTTSTPRKSSDSGKQVFFSQRNIENESPPTTIKQKESSDTRQQDILSARKEVTLTPTNILKVPDNCQCQKVRPFDPKFNASCLTMTNVDEPYNTRQQKERNEVSPPTTNILKKSSETEQQIFSNDRKKENEALPGALEKKESSNTTQQDILTEQKKVTPHAANVLATSSANCQCQNFISLDPKLDSLCLTITNVEESYNTGQQKEKKGVGPPIINTLKITSNTEQQAFPSDRKKENHPLSETIKQKASFDTRQQDISDGRKNETLPATIIPTASSEHCQCQEFKPFDSKLDASYLMITKERKPEDYFFKDFKKVIASTKDLKPRLDSNEKGSQTDQPINNPYDKTPHKHTLNITPINVTIPLRLVLNPQEGQPNIIDTDIIFEASSGTRNHQPCSDIPPTPTPVQHQPMQDASNSEAYFSCLSSSGIIEVEPAPPPTVNPQNMLGHEQQFEDGVCSSTTKIVPLIPKPVIVDYEKAKTESEKLPKTQAVEVHLPLPPPPAIKPQNTEELKQQVKEGTSSSTIISSISKPLKVDYEKAKRESEKLFQIQAIEVELPPPPAVKPPNIEELKQQVKEDASSITITPTIGPSVSKPVKIDYEKAKTESEKLPKTQAIEVDLPPPPAVKPKYIVELKQEVKEGSNSSTLIPTNVPPVSKPVRVDYEKTETESEELPKTQIKSEPKKRIKLVEEKISQEADIQTNPNKRQVVLPPRTEPKSTRHPPRYSTPIDYQGMPFDVSRRQSRRHTYPNHNPTMTAEPVEPIVADKATCTSYFSGHQKRIQMRMAIQDQLKELLQLENTNAKHTYDAEERDEILLELHNLFHPEMVDLLSPELSRENALNDIRYIMDLELLPSTDKEATSLSEYQRSILDNIKRIINPKSVQSENAKKFRKDTKCRILEYLLIILNSPRTTEMSANPKKRNNILNDLSLLLGIGSVNRLSKQEQMPRTLRTQEQTPQQRSLSDIKEDLMGDLKYALDATAQDQEENKENQRDSTKNELLSNNSSDDSVIDSNKPDTNAKAQTPQPRRTLASMIFPKRFSTQRTSTTATRRKTYKDLQSSSSEDFFLDMADE